MSIKAEKQALDWLTRYDHAHRPCTEPCRIASGGGRWLQGVPYIWTGFSERAFVFADRKDANRFLRRFNKSVLGGCAAVVCFSKEETDPEVTWCNVCSNRVDRSKDQHGFQRIKNWRKYRVDALKAIDEAMSVVRLNRPNLHSRLVQVYNLLNDDWVGA